MLLLDRQETIPLEFDATGKQGSSCLAALGPSSANKIERQKIERILDKYVPVVHEPSIGCTDLMEYTIEVISTRPTKQKYYPVSQKVEKIMHSHVKQMDDDIIEPSNSSWSSPVFMVKKGEDKYGFCVDYGKLNKVNKCSARPMPHMDTILRQLRNAEYVSTIVLSMAFNQVPVRLEHRHNMALTVPKLGLFQFKRMPFGLSGSPGTFQSLMDKKLGPDLEPRAFCYLDDIIIVSDTSQEHMELLKEVLKRLSKAGLTINREKCHFCREEVHFLENLVNEDGYKPDPKKVAPIVQYSRPKTLNKLRSFLGAASWYRKFIANFAAIAEPLTALMRKNAKYIWTEDQDRTFNKLKALMASALILPRPEPGDDRFVI